MGRATVDKRAHAPGKYWARRRRRKGGTATVPPPVSQARAADRTAARPDWFAARVAEYRRRAAAALRVLARGGVPESIFAAPLPANCEPIGTNAECFQLGMRNSECGMKPTAPG